MAESADTQITVSLAGCLSLARGKTALPRLLQDGDATIDGDTPLAAALRGAAEDGQ